MSRTSDIFLQYNALDGCCTLEAHDGFWIDLEAGYNPAYDMTARLYEPLMFMMTRGIRVDHKALEETKLEIKETAAQKQEELNQLAGRVLNVNSSKDCQTYFYIEKGIPPYHSDSGGITVDDLALQRMARGTAKREGLREAKLVQEIRGLRKLFSTYLDIEFDKDDRIRCSYNPRGSKFGRLSSSATIFGTGCVPADAEVLTPNGWISIAKWNPELSSIMQYNPESSRLTFTSAKLHKQESPGIMLECFGEQVHQMLTLDHRVLFKPKLKSKFTESRAFDVSQRNLTVLPLSGQFRSGSYYPEYPRLLVAALADGSYEGNRVRVSFKKQRKIVRFLALCKEYRIAYDEQAAQEGYRRFAFDRPTSWPPTKVWDSWILELHADAAMQMLNELGYWDGMIREDSHVLWNASEYQVSWVATLAHLHGYSATIGSMEQPENSYSDTLMWRVNVKPRNYAYVEDKHWSYVRHKGLVYCPIVPTTYWLMRYKGRIAITGNTNLQNLPQEFKKFLRADEGYIFWEVDKRQAEWIVVAYLANDASMIKVAEEGKDAHTYTAAMMFSLPEDVIKEEAKLVGQNTDPDRILEIRTTMGLRAEHVYKMPRTMSCRQAGKRSNHGLNYDEGPNKFALINEIEQTEAKRIIDLYHRVYPGIRKTYHESVKRQLQKDRTLTNCFGRKVRFLDGWGPDLWKAGYSMLPQSTVVDCVNQGMASIYHDDWLCAGTRGADLLAQTHDSILLQVPLEWFSPGGKFPEALERVYKAVSQELEYSGRKFRIATDSKLGLNWGGYNPNTNSQGMRELKSLSELPTILEGLGCLEKSRIGSQVT